MKKHLKHAKLNRRTFGQMAPLEISVLGTKCSVIKELVKQVAIKVNTDYKIAYADASHDQELSPPHFDEYTFHPSGLLSSKELYHMNPYTDKIMLSAYDLVFINGNHYPAGKQILILDSEKEASVLKRLHQLDNIAFLISLNHKSEIFDFLKDAHPDIEQLPMYSIDDLDQISKHIIRLIEAHIAPLHGLVLAGGQSVRMGKDKGLLDYFGKSQRVYSMEMLEKLNLKTFLSVRKEQRLDLRQRIEDTFIGLGPFGAICSAFRFDPNAAYLVLATDLPYADEKLIRHLIEQRDPSKIATALKGKRKEFPEPLITIWEPKAYPILLQFLAQGISCPRKVLINSDVKLVEVDDEYIFNVNTPEEFSQAKQALGK